MKSTVNTESFLQPKEQQDNSKLEALRHRINDGDNSGDLIDWNVDSFLGKMKRKH